MNQTKLIAIIPFTTSGDSGVELGGIAVEEALHNFLTASHISCLLGSKASSSTEAARAEQEARELGAQIVITGKLRKKLNQLDSQLQITDAAGNILFMGPTHYHRNDVSELADANVMQVADILGIRAEITPHTYGYSHADSYDRYLQAVLVERHAKSPKDIEKALVLYKTALILEPDLACAYAGIAEAHLRMFQMTHDTAHLSSSSGAVAQATAAQNTCFSTEYRVAQLLKATGQTISSLSVFKRMSERLLYSDQLKRDIAHVYLRLGMYQDAVSQSLEATAISPRQWRNHEVLGECYLADGKFTNAIATFGDVLALNPSSAVAYHNLGAAYLYNGAFAKAIVPLRRALILQPTAASHSNLGTAQFYLGNAEASVEEYQIALSLNPKSEEYAGNLATAYRLMGRIGKARGYFLRALALARQDLALGTDDPRRLAHIAVYEAQLGHLKTSYRMIAAARNLDPRSGDVLYAQIVVRAIAKDYSGAIESVSQLLALRSPTYLLAANPNFAELRKDRRFIELMKNSSPPQ